MDLHARQLPDDVGEVLAMVKAIASIPLDDGLELDAESATAESIRDQEEYSGVRVTLGAWCSSGVSEVSLRAPGRPWAF